ncbi:MAG: hypothetical protein PHC88_16110 [Terrimicrobiaceae bacterium]|nr:hypothetical protein [Terrimicrobiaceae bacterium]
MSLLRFLILLFAIAIISPTLAKSGQEIRDLIIGSWFQEDIGPQWHYTGARYQYLPNGQCVNDYRISQPGITPRYIRTVGKWELDDHIFWETVDKSTDGSMMPPRLERYILYIDNIFMIVVATGNPKSITRLYRGPDTPKFDSKEANDALFDMQLHKMRFYGWTTFPGEETNTVGWRLESRSINTVEQDAAANP